MAQDSTQERLGACTLTVDGTDLGLTFGDVVYTATAPLVEAHPSQHGAPSEMFTGEGRIVVTGTFAQTLEQTTLLGKILADSTVAGDKVSMGRTPGFRASQNAFELILHPEDQSGTTKDLTIYRALGVGNFESLYSREAVQGFPFEFMGLYDVSRSNGDRLWSLGNSADTTPPTRTSTTPADAAAAQVATVNIVIVFDESMSKPTLVDDNGQSTSVVIYDRTNTVYVPCAATVSTTTNTNDTITLNPDSSLTASATIDVIVTEAARDTAGNSHAGSQTDFTVAV